jgi:hypothetical protein
MIAAAPCTPPSPDGPAPGLADLAARWAAVARLTPSAPDWMDPDDVVAAALSRTGWQVPQPAEGALAATFRLVVRGADALARGGDAAAPLREAMGREPNNLQVQRLLARAEGRERTDPGPGLFCEAPFANIETAPGGEVYLCCPAWLPKPIGSIAESSVDEMWNSPAARDIRASIHDGSFRHCSREHCPKLSGRGLTPKAEIADPALRAIAGARRVRLDRGPRRVTLAHDRSCNLACPSCRTGIIVARKAEQERLDAAIEPVLLPLLRSVRRLRVTASGDPFGSAHFLRLLRRLGPEAYPDLRLELQTNGLLLTDRLWTDLRLDGRVAALLVSVDAATADTYEQVRRPGRWSVLRPNLDLFGRLRREGRVGRYRLDAVVQAANWREVPAILDLARAVGADGVKLQMLRSWHTWSPRDFARQDVGDPAHPDHAAAMRVLAEARAGGFAEVWGAPLAGAA